MLIDKWDNLDKPTADLLIDSTNDITDEDVDLILERYF
jgi:hypothetical protein